MKKIYILLIAVIASFSLNAQMENFTETSENGDYQVKCIMAEKGQTISDFIDEQSLRTLQFEINPGYEPEGDYIHRLAYSGDGALVLQANALTNNVTIFDAETLETIANVPVGFFPVDVACTQHYAIVPCVFADSVFVIDLSDFSIAATFVTGEQPATVEVSPDGSKAFVGCDIDDVLEVIDLENMVHEKTISNFPVALKSLNFITGSGRFYYTWQQFEVSPDGQYVVTSDYDDKILFFDVDSGLAEHEISGLGYVTELNFSGDGENLIAVKNANPAVLYQISVADFTVVKSVTLDALGIWGGGVAVNQSGSKAFLGVNGNQTALVRFDSEDYLLYLVTQTAFWCDNNYDHQYAISGQFRFTIFDFEAETTRGSYWGNSQYLGAVSPVANKAVGVDPGRYEGPAFYSFDDPQVVNFMGNRPSGEMPEGDVPYRVAVADDGNKAVVVNNLSENVSIINLNTNEVEDIIDIGEAGNVVKITHDSKWAIVGGYDLNTIKIIDLETNELATTVATGQRPGMIAIAPDDSYAYIGNVKSNNVSFVKLDGANSVNEKTISVGIIGLSWAAFGVRSAVEISPTGEYLLVAVSFDDNVKVIDTQTQEIVATLPVGDFPLQIAFNGDGTFAVVTNYSENSYSVIRVDGANSSVVGTFPSAASGPIRLKYNPIKDEVSIVHLSDSQLIMNVDPETGDVLSTFSYPTYGSPLQIEFNDLGEPVVLTGPTSTKSAQLIYDGDAFELPSSPIHFDFSKGSYTAVVAEGGGGQDMVTVFRFPYMGVGDVSVTRPGVKPFYITAISPNPVTDFAEVKFWKSNDFASPIKAIITDINGKTLFEKAIPSNDLDGEFSIDLSEVKPGTYLLSLKSEKFIHTKKIVVN